MGFRSSASISPLVNRSKARVYRRTTVVIASPIMMAASPSEYSCKATRFDHFALFNVQLCQTFFHVVQENYHVLKTVDAV